MDRKSSKKWPEVWPGYETVEKLGAGGYGTVWKVRKKDSSGEYYSAVKKISIPSNETEYASLQDSGYGDKEITTIFRSRLDKIEAEFKLMEEFKGDSHIVSYLEHTEVQHDDGMGWDILIRMELLTPLAKCYDRFSEKEAVRLGVHICTALETIERKGIIHRDIKPSNILYNDSLGYYKLSDFGIAKSMDHVTKGTMIGTADYIAPEVFNKEAYGFQADQYSLGLVLYWMLNKRKLPFIPLDHVPTDDEIQSAKQKRVNGVALPAPLHGSAELKSVVLKACAFEPADRYPNITAMKRALESCMDKADTLLFTDSADNASESFTDDLERKGQEQEKDLGSFDYADIDDDGTMGRFDKPKKPSGSSGRKGKGRESGIGSAAHGTRDDSTTIKDLLELLDVIERYDLNGSGNIGAELYKAQVMDMVDADPSLAYTIYGYYSNGYRENGHIIPQNLRKADEWLKTGAELGDEDCIRRIGMSEAQGKAYDDEQKRREQEQKDRLAREAEKRRLEQEARMRAEEAKRAEEENRQQESVGFDPDEADRLDREEAERLRRGKGNTKPDSRPANTPKKVPGKSIIAAAAALIAICALIAMISGGKSNKSSVTLSSVENTTAQPSTASGTLFELLDSSKITTAANETYTVNVVGGTIYKIDEEENLELLGSSGEMHKGDNFFLLHDPDDNGYKFKEWTVNEGSYRPYGNRHTVKAQDATFEAVFEPWVFLDWIPVLNGIDNLLAINGSHDYDLSKDDVGGTVISEGFPLTFDDSYPEVCQKIGATADMASDFQETEKNIDPYPFYNYSGEVYIRNGLAGYDEGDSIFCGLTFYDNGMSMNLQSRRFSYVFWFDKEDKLYRIRASEK